ncbi:hypothetical protein ASC97_09135 [Rhizobium sp. Root1203]|nr:hypothetical protein ASC97_09135 [Rhizobium sp. Root1203]
MFLEDEFAVRRLRASRLSLSLLVVFVAFAASAFMMFGLVTAANADERQQKSDQLAGLVRQNDVNSGSLLFPTREPGFFVEAPRLKTDVQMDVSGPVAHAELAATRMATAPTPKAASLIAQKSATVILPQTATRADEQIMRGLTALLSAIAAASGLAVWRRRVRGVFVGAKRNER